MRWMWGRDKVRQAPVNECPGCSAKDQIIRYLQGVDGLHRQRLEEENRLIRDQLIEVLKKPDAVSENILTEPESTATPTTQEELEIEEADHSESTIGRRAREELDRIHEATGIPVELLADV